MTTQVVQDHKGIATDKINALMHEMLKHPQVECPVSHHFGPNIYIREVVMPAGTVVVGKPHKTEHMCNMISGRMIVVNEDGEQTEVAAPAVFMAKKGRKTAYIIETVRFQNIFSTDETNIEKLENMLVDNSPLLLEEEK